MLSTLQLTFMDATSCSHAELEQNLLPRLHAAEQSRYRTFSHPRRRHTWLAGRALLIESLCRQFKHVDTTALRTHAQGGVKYQDGIPHLSLSHTRGLIVAGVWHARIGVDIEYLRPRAALQHAERVLTSEEAEQLRGLPEPDRQDRFYALWTLKEAACKAACIPLSDCLRSTCFDLAASRFRLRIPFPSGGWRFLSACIEPAWRLAVAMDGAGRAPQIECWRLAAPDQWHKQVLARQSFLHEK